MQKILKFSFFHDSRFKQAIDGEHYSTGTLTRRLFETRYLRFAESLTVVSRVEQARAGETESLAVAEHPAVRFIPVNFNNPLSLFLGRHRKTITEAVADSDFIVIRLPSLIGLSAALEAKKQNKPYMIELVGCVFDSMWNYGSKTYRIAAGGLYAATRRAVLNAPHVIYVTEFFLQSRYPTRGEEISCSNVSLQEISKDALQRRESKILQGSSEDDLILGSIGNVGLAYKGHEYVIRSLPRLVSRGLRVKYQIVGGGDQARLRQIADELGVQNNVEFLGTLDHASVFEWLDSVDVYAQPSLTEGLPRALVEAMSRGCACIGTQTGGIPELLEADDIVTTKAIGELSARVVEYVEDRDLRLRAAERNMQKSRAYLEETLELRRNQFIASALSSYRHLTDP